MNNPDILHIHLQETESTNTYARKQPQQSGILLITTDYQTAGRGQRGNTWESERNRNLLFSLVLYPHKLPAIQQFVLCEIISVALCKVLGRYTDGICIKWPNDIYYHNRKLCGILIEHDIEGAQIIRTIIGVGINANQTLFISNAPNPISLNQILGHEIDRKILLTEICNEVTSLLYSYSIIETTKKESISYRKLKIDSLHTLYNTLLYRRNIVANYCDTNGTFTATLHEVKSDGRLILKKENGQLCSYLFKEITYII